MIGDQLLTWEDADAFRATMERRTGELQGEGFARTTLEAAEPVQHSDRKVHFAVRPARRRADGSVYAHIETLWLFTLEDDHRGVKARSSFLGGNYAGGIERA